MKQTIALLALALFVAACGGSEDSKQDAAASDSNAVTRVGDTPVNAPVEPAGITASQDTNAPAATPGTAQKKYTIKSGIVEATSEAMGKQTSVTYFDDYGMKEASYAELMINGEKSHAVTITRDGWIYNFNVEKKAGTKTPVRGPGEMGGLPDLMNLTDDMKKQYNYKELEDRTLLGKKAKGISMQLNGITYKTWTWENVPLLAEVELPGQKLLVTATSIKPNADVPADKFEVPGDIKFTEPASGPVTVKPEHVTIKPN